MRSPVPPFRRAGAVLLCLLVGAGVASAQLPTGTSAPTRGVVPAAALQPPLPLDTLPLTLPTAAPVPPKPPPPPRPPRPPAARVPQDPPAPPGPPGPPAPRPVRAPSSLQTLPGNPILDVGEI